MMLLTDVPGNACLSSLMKKDEASARSARPNSESVMKTSGTNDRSAKYATIAARWVPRSAKNLCTSWRLRMRTIAESAPCYRRAMDAAAALADLVEISPQIEAAALLAGDGELAGSVGVPETRANILARAARELLDGAAAYRTDHGRVTQLHAEL